MTIIILPICTMAIGFLLGIVTMDTFRDTKELDRLERKVKRLERRMNG